MNEPLQKRAGNNIGVSPAFWSGYQQHVDANFLKLENTDTVLWEGVEGCVRCPGGTKPKNPGILLTKDATLGNIEVLIVFIDHQGNEFVIGDGGMLTGDGTGFIFIDGVPAGKLGLAPFGLCPGEKIVARVVITGMPPSVLPNGKVIIVPYTKDIKSKGGGKGGLSDGGALCQRAQVVNGAGATFGPRAGTTWEEPSWFGSTAGGGGFGGGLMISNADPTADAELVVCYVAPDGTEFPVVPGGGVVLVPPKAIFNVAGFFGWFEPLSELRSYIQYPQKLRVKFAPGEPVPAGRVEALLMVLENDIAPDLVEVVP
jgi:hypothetical protein